MKNKYLTEMLDCAPEEYSVYIDGRPAKTCFIEHYNKRINITSEDFFQLTNTINSQILPVIRTAAVANITM